MRLEFRKQFLNNLKSIKDKSLADEIEFILSAIEETDEIETVPGLKKLKGYSDFYRIRINDYRIGIKVSGNTVIVVCIYHRSVIYKLFP